jgi:hypothetical protein
VDGARALRVLRKTAKGLYFRERGAMLNDDELLLFRDCRPFFGHSYEVGTFLYFFDALIFAQRALCAAAILLRPAADMALFFRLDFPPPK